MSHEPSRTDPSGGQESPPAGGAGEGLLHLALDRFEGPLDLLLHLVRSQEMDILDLPIVEIARQYNAYLARMRELDLEIASEYLVMAATLAHIKSRLLLPPEPAEEIVEDRIPEEPVARRRVAVRRERPEPRESLADRLAERLRSQDMERPESRDSEPAEVQQAASASATVTVSRFPYAWYLSIIQGKVSSNWKQPSSRLITQDQLSTQVSFRIRRDGTVELVAVRRSSGRSSVGQSGLR